jgi:large subunit ribosomal protein L10
MLSKALKKEVVKEYNGKFKSHPYLFLVEYKGLTVKEMETLRRNLKKAEAELKVIKNSLLRIATRDTDVEKIQDLFSGPTAVAISKEDPVSVAKVFTDSLKVLPVLKLKGGVVEGRVLDANEIIKLSKLPPREMLYSQLLGLLSSPLSNLMGTLMELQRRLLYALNAVKEMKEEGE